MNLDRITNKFLEEFPGDVEYNLQQRQTPGFLYALVKPEEFPDGRVVVFNEDLAKDIGFGSYSETSSSFLYAQSLPSHINTYATAYAGHQFGNWAGQLGDGRAIYAGEIENEIGNSYELQWKGVGATPYSRFADGRAVLRSSIREYLMSEAMFYLNIPTTRALGLSETGEDVIRDIAYNGNAKAEKGAAVLRVAESFIRFGHFELLAARKEYDTLEKLCRYIVSNYLRDVDLDSSNWLLDFFQSVVDLTAETIIDWYRVGFVHGVMNTDNMSILGLTIDYGPFSMVDEYDLNFTPNTTDLPGRRYAFGKQGQIAHWNLMQLANALFPLIKDDSAINSILESYSDNFWNRHDDMLRKKFGFDILLKEDEELFIIWQQMMQDLKIDYSLFFVLLEKSDLSWKVQDFQDCFYNNLDAEQSDRFLEFVDSYHKRLQLNVISHEDRKKMMSENNPKFILRNYQLYECIAKAEEGDYTLFNQWKEIIKTPYSDEVLRFNKKRPISYNKVMGCSLLSCSS